MAARGPGKTVGLAAVAAVSIAGLLASFVVIRNAAVADRQSHPALAAALWPSHPSVITENALLGIAATAARGQSPPPSLSEDVRRIATMAPLSPEPFLFEGAVAETKGNGRDGEALLTEARARDPRSRGARYLLAERYIRTGRMADGFIEMQVLIGLQAQGLTAFVPALAGYARTPGAIPEMRKFFSRHPMTEPSVLSILATDAGNADLVMALATNIRNPQPDWRATLVSRLAAAGQYDKAYSSWLRLSRLHGRGGLYNAAFAALPAPPPFNWYFADTTEGTVEPDGKGSLDILYYGRVSTVFASQTMLISPGSYRLGMKVVPSDGDPIAIRWRARCLPGEDVLAELPLRSGQTSGSFTVAPACKAIRLELLGIVGDVPATTELAISDLRLDPVATR